MQALQGSAQRPHRAGDFAASLVAAGGKPVASKTAHSIPVVGIVLTVGVLLVLLLVFLRPTPGGYGDVVLVPSGFGVCMPDRGRASLSHERQW